MSENIGDIVFTQVEEVVLYIMTLANKPQKASYTLEHKKQWEEDTSSFGVHYWGKLRNRSVSGNIAMHVAEDVAMEWQVPVALSFMLEPNVSLNDHTKVVIKKFQEFAKDCPKILGTPTYNVRKVVSDLKPLNHYLLNHDVHTILKMIYSTSAKEDLMECESIMEAFYGTVDEGKALLSGINEYEWENLVGGDDDE